MRFLYFYLMGDDRDRIRTVAFDHSRYWDDLRLGSYLGGPFADRSGGLITFETGSLDGAERLVAGDPFVQQGLLDHSWLREWLVN